MSTKLECIDLLEAVRYERLCASCWALVLTEYLDESLGWFKTVSTFKGVRDVDSIVITGLINPRKSAAQLLMISRDCDCDVRNLREEEKDRDRELVHQRGTFPSSKGTR